MMKSTLPQGIKTLKNWRDKGTLTFDNPIQRAGSQWSLLQKSLLIHSMISGYPIPACYFLKSKNEEGDTIYDCLDAKQRLTSIFEFIGEEGYALHSATPPVVYDGFEHDLADMKFEDLADELQDEILGYRLSIFCLEDCSDEEVEEIFARLNNSTPLSAIQKCRSVMGSDLARWCKEMCDSDFYQHSVNLTLAQVRREADLETLLQSMLLLDSRHEGYDDWKAISTAEVTKYCKHIRGTYNDDKRLMIMEILEYLSKAFPNQHKFLKKSNVPTIIVLAKLALENDISAEDFRRFINSFSNSICLAFEENTGSGNVKRAKTEGRLKAIAAVFADEFDLKNINILEVEVDADSLSGYNAEAEITGTDDEEAVNTEESAEETEETVEEDNTEEPIDDDEPGEENFEDNGFDPDEEENSEVEDEDSSLDGSEEDSEENFSENSESEGESNVEE